MSNKRRETVSYQQFRPRVNVSSGLLPVNRPDLMGDMERKVAQGWFRLADASGRYADKQAAYHGAKAGLADALANVPQTADVTGDAGSGYSGGRDVAQSYKAGDPVADDLQPHQKAFLNAVASGESSGKYNIRYTPNGGANFADLSKHPNIAERTKDGRTSTAAGRYQFTYSTWNKMGGGDFSPANQDRRAYQLAMRDYKDRTGRSLDDDLQQHGMTEQITAALAPTWEAFKNNQAAHIETYNNSLKRYSGTDPVITSSMQTEGDPTENNQAAKLSVAAPGIVPVEIKLEQKGNFKPTGHGTVYERAYDAAGTRTYLQMLDTAVQTDIMNVYDAAKNDPVQLEKKLNDLKILHLQEHGITDEIRPAYEESFTKTALPLLRQAKLDQAKRLESQNQADFLSRTNDLTTERSRRLAALSFDNPDTVDAVWNVQNAINDHYDTTVLHGLMTPQQAEKSKMASQRVTALQFYSKQAEGKTPEQIRQIRADMQKDFASGNLSFIDGDGWALLDTQLQRIENTQSSAGKKAALDYAQKGQVLLNKVEAGFDIDPTELSEFGLAMNAVPDGQKIHDALLGKIGVAIKIRDAKMGDADQFVQQMQKSIGRTPSNEQADLYAYAQQSLDAKRKMLLADPIGYGEALQIIAPTGGLTDNENPADMIAAMQQRIEAGNQIGQYFGIVPRYLRPGEAAGISKIITANPETGIALAAAIVEGAGANAQQVLTEFGDAAPQIMQSGSILAMGGSAQAAQDVLYGYGKNDAGQAYKIMPLPTRRARNDIVIGKGLDLVPTDKKRITQAANAIARKRLYEQGIDPKDDDAEDVYDRALQESAGGVFIGDLQYGGFTRSRKAWYWGGSNGAGVLVDPNIRADRLDDVIDAIKTRDFKNDAIKPVRADGRSLPDGYFNGAYPVAVNGGYLLSTTNPETQEPQWIMGSDSRPFVLDLNKYRAVLSARVPGAFKD